MQRFSYGDKDTGSQPQRQRPSIRNHKVLVAALALVTAVLLLGISYKVNPTPTAKAATFTQVFGEEFNGAANTGVNTSTWRYDTGTGFGTGEIETMTTSTNNVYQDGSGHLVIKAINSGGSWTSGRIETNEDDFAAPAGGELEITASLQQPNVSGAAALGYWPAFWTLGTPFRTDGGQWPKDGEVDIMEDVNGLSSVYGTLHCGVDPGGPCNETSGLGSGQRACSGCQTSFHTYTEIIDRSVSPEQIRWYLDGNNYFTVNASQMDATTWANAVDHAFFIIFDLAMGGGFPNGVSGQTTPTSSTQSGAAMLVDYVRVYTAPGSAPNPTPTSTTSAPTATPTHSAPTATPTSSGTGFAQGVSSNSSSSATFWFQPQGWTAGYAILHYTPSGQGQQNVNMTYNSSTARWEYTVNGLSSGQTVTYSFTYQRGGLQYDTGNYTWTNNGSSPTPTPAPPTATPTPSCTGAFAQGVTNVSSSQARFWFQPCGWTAGYVIVHYTVTGQTPQNVNMTYNSSTGHWEFTANISSGQSVTYSFTYQKSGLQYDTGNYTWTHP